MPKTKTPQRYALTYGLGLFVLVVLIVLAVFVVLQYALRSPEPKEPTSTGRSVAIPSGGSSHSEKTIE